MGTAILLVRLFDGARRPFRGNATVRLFDGAQRQVHTADHALPNIEFTIPVSNGPNDTYRVTVDAPNRLATGQMAIPLRTGTKVTVDLMLIPKRSQPVFTPLAGLNTVHPRLEPLMRAYLTRKLGADSQENYAALQEANTAGLMTLLGIASAFADFSTPHPLDFIDSLVELEPDRFFALAREPMSAFLDGQPQIFGDALSLLHPGAFKSFKEKRYPEGNVQFTFTRVDEPTLLKLDADIDLFADKGAHFFLEVLPGDVFNPPSVTDPRRAYAMRWMSVRRAMAAGRQAAGFDPPYTLELG